MNPLAKISGHVTGRPASFDTGRSPVALGVRHFIADYDAVVESRKRALPYMPDAHRRVWQTDLGMNRFVPRTRWAAAFQEWGTCTGDRGA
jgi:hypothetical protein